MMSNRSSRLFIPLNVDPQSPSGGTGSPLGTERTAHPGLSSLDFGDASVQAEGFVYGCGAEVGDLELGCDVSDPRCASDSSPGFFISVGYGEVEAVAVYENRDDAAVDDFLRSTAVVRPGLPGADGLVPLPFALDPQSHFIVGPAAVTVADRPQILKCLLAHRHHPFVPANIYY